jgi:hypothetical protein
MYLLGLDINRIKISFGKLSKVVKVGPRVSFQRFLLLFFLTKLGIVYKD